LLEFAGLGFCVPVMTLGGLPQVCSRKQMLVGAIGPGELARALSEVRTATNDGERTCQSVRGIGGCSSVTAFLIGGISIELEHEGDHGGGSKAIVVCADVCWLEGGGILGESTVSSWKTCNNEGTWEESEMGGRGTISARQVNSASVAGGDSPSTCGEGVFDSVDKGALTRIYVPKPIVSTAGN